METGDLGRGDERFCASTRRGGGDRLLLRRVPASFGYRRNPGRDRMRGWSRGAMPTGERGAVEDAANAWDASPAAWPAAVPRALPCRLSLGLKRLAAEQSEGCGGDEDPADGALLWGQPKQRMRNG
jgi:hypothetical protein